MLGGMRDQTVVDPAAASSANPSAADWAAARGEKWRAQRHGMEATLRPINEPILSALALTAPLRIADLGCGGGDTARAILRGAPAGSEVCGFDIAAGLIADARREIPAGEQALSFAVADLATAQPPAPFDRLVSRFGLMFFDDPPAAFANLRRWLQPRGRFAFAVWGRPADNAWFQVVRDVVGQHVALPAADPDAPGPFRYGDAERLLALLAGAGFAELALHTWTGRLPIGGGLGADAAAEFALAAFSSFGELLAKAGDDALQEATRDLGDRLRPHEQSGRVHMAACVHIVTGSRGLLDEG